MSSFIPPSPVTGRGTESNVDQIVSTKYLIKDLFLGKICNSIHILLHQNMQNHVSTQISATLSEGFERDQNLHRLKIFNYTKIFTLPKKNNIPINNCDK